MNKARACALLVFILMVWVNLQIPGIGAAPNTGIVYVVQAVDVESDQNHPMGSQEHPIFTVNTFLPDITSNIRAAYSSDGNNWQTESGCFNFKVLNSSADVVKSVTVGDYQTGYTLYDYYRAIRFNVPQTGLYSVQVQLYKWPSHPPDTHFYVVPDAGGKPDTSPANRISTYLAQDQNIVSGSYVTIASGIQLEVGRYYWWYAEGAYRGSWKQNDWGLYYYYRVPDPSVVSIIMNSSFRNSNRDSFGNPFKMSWFCEADKYYASAIWPANEASGFTALLQTLQKYWTPEIELYGDELQYHHHNMMYINGQWVATQVGVTDPSNPAYTYMEDALNYMIIDQSLYASTYRAGWVWEDGAISEWLNEWFPFDYCIGTNYFPSHPAGEERWVINADMFVFSGGSSDTDVEYGFQQAAQGRPVIAALYGHNEWGDLDYEVSSLHSQLVRYSQMYNVSFRYCGAKEAMQRYLVDLGYSVEYLPPTLQVTRTGEHFTITSDEPLWGDHPYVALSFKNGTYTHASTTKVGTNTWTTQAKAELDKIGVAANDMWGNTAVLVQRALGPTPIAAFTYLPASPAPLETVNFDASSSTPSASGTITGYEWYFGDGAVTMKTTPTTTHQYTSEGTYTVTLNVTDSNGLWDTESKPITVKALQPLVVSISPASIVMDLGQSQQFTSAVSGGAPPYAYQWFLNSAPISGATGSTWTFTPISTGTYSVFLRVTDSRSMTSDSSTASVTVNPALTVSISPASATMDVGQSRVFTSTVTGGTAPYSYQWYLNDAPVTGATSSTWTFTPTTAGTYVVYARATDAVAVTAESNHATVTVGAVTEKTFGKTNVGASSYAYYGGYNYAHACRFQMPNENGQLTKISLYVVDQWGGIKIRVAIYADNNGVPGALIAGQSATQSVSSGWNNFPLSAPLTANTWYWFAWWGDRGGFTERCDAGSYLLHWNNQGSSAWINPFGSKGNDGKLTVSVYATYTTTAMTVSISPTSATMDVGQSRVFTSTVTGGTAPYSYQWYRDGSPVSGATSSTWTFTPAGTGTYSVFLRVTDSRSATSDSSTASVIVHANLVSTTQEVWIFVDSESSLGDDGRILSSVVEGLTGIKVMCKANNFPNNVEEYQNVALVILRGGDSGTHDYSEMSSTQKSALKQYVQQGGCLYVEVYPDYVSGDWFGTGLLAYKRIVTSTCRYSFSGFLKGLFGNYTISPYYHMYGGYYYDDQSWGRVINGSNLPSTIQAVVSSDNDGIIYAGTYGSGKLALVSGSAINYAIWSGSCSAVYSPILLSVIDYLLNPAYHRMQCMTPKVAFRIDDLPADQMREISDLLRSHGANKIALGYVPNNESWFPEWWFTWTENMVEAGSIFAMHGDIRGHVDYTTATYDDFRKGKELLETLYGVTPTWFFCPGNTPRSDTSDAYLRELGFAGVSSSFLIDEEYSNHLRPAGIYQIGSDGPPYEGGAGWIVNRPEASMMISSFLTGEPFTLLLHPGTSLQAIEEFFALVETYYPEVRYVGMDDLHKEAYLSLRSGPLWQWSLENQFSYFNVSISESSASVSLKPNKYLNGEPSNGTFYLEFYKAIQSVQINGQDWNAWNNNVLILPLFSTGVPYQIEVQFGVPFEPHIVYKDYVITDYSDFNGGVLLTRITGTSFYNGLVKVKTEGLGSPQVVEVNGVATAFDYDGANDLVTFSVNYTDSQVKDIAIRWSLTSFNVYLDPSSASIVMDLGQSQQFTSTVSGGVPPYAYQWFLNDTPISGATASAWTFTPTSTGTYSVFLRVTDNESIICDSNRASITVNPAPTVSISPVSATIDVGQSRVFTSTVTGGTAPYGYQWYLNDAPVAGATSSTWTFTPAAAGTYVVYVRATDAVAVTAESNHATVTVTVGEIPLVVSINPASIVMDIGQSQQFGSVVSGGVPPYAYQWFLNSAPISGATGSTWTFTPTETGAYSVFLRVTDSRGTASDSNTASVTVNAAPTVSINPASATIDLGQSQLFASTVSGGTAPYTYQWYLDGSPVTGATSSSWAFTPITAGTYTVYVRVTDAASVTAESNHATIIVEEIQQLVVSISPASIVMDLGQSRQFTSAVSGGVPPYAYQWFLNSAPISGATGSAWTFTPTSAGTYSVFLRVTDSRSTVSDSSTASVTVNPAPTVSISPTSATIDLGQSQLFTSTVSGGTSPHTYQWYLNDAPVAGATSSTWTFTPAAAGTYTVYVRVTDAASVTAESNHATVTVGAVTEKTFGKTNIGGSSYVYYGGYNYAHACRFQMPNENGQLTKITLYVRNPWGNIQVRVAIYADNNGVPGAFIAGGSLKSVTNGWNDFPLSASLTANTWYWIVWWGDRGGFTERYDSGSYLLHWNDQGSGAWDNPFGSLGNDGMKTISVYATYTTGT